MKGELELPFAADEVSRQSAAHDLPLIYIASPLTRADRSPEQRWSPLKKRTDGVIHKRNDCGNTPRKYWRKTAYDG